MKNKIAFFFLAVVGTLVLGILGLVIASTWGGNYAVDFVAFDLRGYEATGVIGASIGLVVGAVLSLRFYHKLFCEKGL